VDRVAVALGSNLGDRRAHLDFAVSKLQALLRHIVVSRYRDTRPVDVSGPQPLYLNAAAVGDTALAPRDLLDALLAIEAARGRQRPFPNAPRTLDLDLILYGAQVIDEPGLVVPHPRFRDRRFVLEPLAEIAPEMLDPVTGESLGTLLERVAGDRGPSPA
jgi:2-amino-4-hydroxy-6-hydroxymethyldihydropteridine diphosphokinase